jgi:hypothetical protein
MAMFIESWRNFGVCVNESCRYYFIPRQASLALLPAFLHLACGDGLPSIPFSGIHVLIPIRLTRQEVSRQKKTNDHAHLLSSPVKQVYSPVKQVRQPLRLSGDQTVQWGDL